MEYSEWKSNGELAIMKGAYERINFYLVGRTYNLISEEV